MERILNFKVKSNSYTINFPNVGEFRRIESLKQFISNGMYNQLTMTSTKAAQHAADMVDIEATLTVMCPQLIKDFKCENFEKMGISDYKELRVAYADQFSPWWNDIMKEIGLEEEA